MNRNELSALTRTPEVSRDRLRARFWIESALAVLNTALAVLTVIWPDWIELAFGYEPDAGNGWVEIGLTVGMAIASLVFVRLANLEWRSRATRLAGA
jgi:hypothetical protein